MKRVYLSGIGMTEFGSLSETPLLDLGVKVAKLALADAGLDYDAVGEVIASSMLGAPQTALKVAHRLGRTGVPVTAIESASAGGLVALRHAAWAVASGRCNTALAVGYEKVTKLEPGGVVPAPVGMWDRFPPQVHYAIEANHWLRHNGAPPELLATIAAKAWNQARKNPLAARQADHEVTTAEVLAARPIAGPLTRMMCHVAADGAAAIVVTAEPLPGSVSLLSIEQTSELPDPNWPTQGPAVGSPLQTTLAARRAYESAGIAPSEVDVVSVHDMCISEEITALVALGLVSNSDVVDLVLAGGLASGGTLPTNTDGGCIARGHPIGATGAAQTAELVLQLRGSAGERQVKDANVGLVQAAGGGGSCAVALLAR